MKLKFWKDTTKEVAETLEKQNQVVNSTVIQKSLSYHLREELAKGSNVEDHKIKIKEHENSLKEFNTANEDLQKKIVDLELLGFSNTPSVLKLKHELEGRRSDLKNKMHRIKNEIEENKQLNEMISHYAIKYPGYKFISYNAFVEVMKKYNIFMGEVGNYTKEIPVRALQNINNFKKEIIESQTTFHMRFSGSHAYDETSYIKSLNESGKVSELYYMPSGVRKDFKSSKLKMVAPIDHFNIEKIIVNGKTVDSLCVNKDNIFEINSTGINELVREHMKVLDPIAVLAVDDISVKYSGKRSEKAYDIYKKLDGFIVLDAWDEEAKIPEIKNTILN